MRKRTNFTEKILKQIAAKKYKEQKKINDCFMDLLILKVTTVVGSVSLDILLRSLILFDTHILVNRVYREAGYLKALGQKLYAYRDERVKRTILL